MHVDLIYYSIVQVPDDSGVPDNKYTGEMYYERKGSNKWLMRFMIVQNIKVFQKVIDIIYTVCIYILNCKIVR